MSGNYPSGVTDNDPHFADDVRRCDVCNSTECDENEYGEVLCGKCSEELEQRRAEAAYERQQEEGFRGGESAAYDAEQQARIQRELK